MNLTTPKMRLAGGAFASHHRDLLGPTIDWTNFDPAAFDPVLLREARHTWMGRAQSEFRSAQLLSRFLQDLLGANDPVDTYAGAAEMIRDELRHVGLCLEVCRHLGAAPRFPEPMPPDPSDPIQPSSCADRALHMALSMLVISETLSTGFIQDLAQRCTTPGISDVVRATIEDEDTHGRFGWDYLEASITRYDNDPIPKLQELVRRTLQPHHIRAEQALAAHPGATLADFAEPERAALGLHSPQRLALLFHRTLQNDLMPDLQRLGLA